MRFPAGADTFLTVLIAQNSLFSAQLTLISLKLAAMQNAVTLYKALGGGWQEHSSQLALPTRLPHQRGGQGPAPDLNG
jgi:outer membrane protein, multidrug efflux system